MARWVQTQGVRCAVGSVAQGESSRRGSGAILKDFSAGVATRVGGTRCSGAAGFNPERRAV